MPVIEKRSGIISVGTEFVSVNSRIIDSSNVESVAWPRSGEPLMIVRYRSGKMYGYLGVSRQRAVAAAYYFSTGIYINERIKGKFKPVEISQIG